MTKAPKLRFLFLLACACVASSRVAADAPPILPVQGYLTDTAGMALEGSHRLTFTLYDAESGGTGFFTDDYTSIELQGGAFAVYLGAQTGGTTLDLSVFQGMTDIWLEVVVDGTEIITPRTRLGSMGYAGFAQYCGDALTAQSCGDATTVGGMAPAAFAASDHTHTSFAGPVGIGGAAGAAPLSITASGGDGALVLQLATERPWCFMQYNTGPPSSLRLSSGCGGTNNNKNFLIDTVGSVGIGTLTPASTLEVAGGCITGSMCSDARMKKDIKPFEGQVLDKVERLHASSYQWKDRSDDKEYLGLIAQEVEKVFPGVVTSGRDGKEKGLSCTGLNAITIEAVKELKSENDELRARLERLERQLGAAAAP